MRSATWSDSDHRVPGGRGARTGVCIAALLALACHDGETRSPAGETQPPNILLIVADDLGFDDIGAYGSSRARTPRIDQLAASGTRFTRFYTAGDTCAPTRASLLTGLYPQRLGFDATPRALPGEVVTLPELLGEAGYATHHVGKWHLGVEAVSTPSAHGFDTFFGFLHARRLTPWGNSYRNPHLIAGEGEPLRRQGHLTDVLTASAVETIRAGVDGQPWFLNLWYFAPHEPVQPPDRWAKRYSDDPEGRYRALISALDEGIGRVLDALDETDQARRTIVVFLSDNGAKEAEHNLPFFGAKTRLFEGGVRVPMILRLPGRAAPRSVDQPVISMDLLPTFASLAGASPLPPIDGVDLGPLLDGAGGALPERSLFWESTPYALPAALDMRALPVVSPAQLPSETAYSVLSPDGRWRLSNRLGRPLCLRSRDLRLQSVPPGLAQRRDRARIAPRRADNTHLAAQLHQGLIELAHIASRQDRLGHGPEQTLPLGRMRIAPIGRQPAQQSDGVCFQDRHGQVESDRQYGPGRVASHTRQLAGRRGVSRKHAPMFGDEDSCRRMKLPCPTVVAQTFPQPQHSLLLGPGKGLDGRKRPHEALEIRGNRGHLRLLQHDLAHPDPIRIARLPPRQVPSVLAVPGAKPASQRTPPVGDRTRVHKTLFHRGQ